MNIFLRIGEWLDRKTVNERLKDMEEKIQAFDNDKIKLLEAEKVRLEKDMKDFRNRLMKVELHTGLHAQATRGDINALVKEWHGLGQ